jgi:hypothetical protein
MVFGSPSHPVGVSLCGHRSRIRSRLAMLKTQARRGTSASTVARARRVSLRGVLIALALLARPLFAQERPSTSENPLAQLKDQVRQVLADAELPGSPADRGGTAISVLE